MAQSFDEENFAFQLRSVFQAKGLLTGIMILLSSRKANEKSENE
jgi:hypothetical protein